MKIVNKRIENLETDLSDGLLLIELIQILSHKKLTRYNKKPTMRMQQLENVSVALEFLKSENVQLVNIGNKFNFSHCNRNVLFLTHVRV